MPLTAPQTSAAPDANLGGHIVARLRDRVIALAGWRRCLTAMVLGALAAIALPPWNVVPLLIPAFVGLIWLVDGTRGWRPDLLAGWCFGFGHFLVGLHWIAEPLLVDPARHAWLIPFAVLGLAGGLALFPAIIVAALAWLVRSGLLTGPARVIALAGLWMVVEWLRGWVFTGFPWNLIGYAWSASPAVLQTAAVAGIYGLSLVTIAAAAMPAVLGDRPARRHSGSYGLGLTVLFTLLLPGLLWLGGTLRLSTAPGAGTAMVPDVQLRIVQANIPQRLKWLPELRQANLEKHVDMSRRPPVDGAAVSHVIWPETAVPFFLDNDAAARALAAAAVPDRGLLITGSPRTEPVSDRPRRFWNSIHAIDTSARTTATYDKAHLVPFGEYVPARGVLPIDKLVAGQGDFTPGPGRRTLRLAGLPPVSALVCYEAIFPGEVVDRDDRPSWLLNLTNDAWFGTGAGPAQHLAIARLRAVEEGLPLVRAANTGISAVVDPYGRIIARLGIEQEGVIDVGLPLPIDAPPLFARLGTNITVLWLLLVSVVLSALLRPRRPTGA